MLRSEQVIVTGATGFVGRHLTPLLVQAGHRVVAVVRDVAAAREAAWLRDVQLVAGDVVTGEVDLEPDAGAALIHLAWAGLPNYNAPLHFEGNLFGSYRLVKTLVERGVARVLVTGTCFEYGLASGPIAADRVPDPATLYAASKDALRRALTTLSETGAFELQWVRLFYMHGPGQSARSVLALLDAAIDRGAASFDMSGGEQLRDYLPIEAVAQGLLDRFHDGAPGISQICSGVPISIRRLVEQRIAERGATIALNLGHYPYPTYEPMAFWGVPDRRESAA